MVFLFVYALECVVVDVVDDDACWSMQVLYPHKLSLNHRGRFVGQIDCFRLFWDQNHG